MNAEEGGAHPENSRKANSNSGEQRSHFGFPFLKFMRGSIAGMVFRPPSFLLRANLHSSGNSRPAKDGCSPVKAASADCHQLFHGSRF